MSQDIVSDGLNQIMNALKARKTSVEIKNYSKLLVSVLAIAKLRGYIESYSVENKILSVKLGKLNACKAIKPRFAVQVDEIEKYVNRYLPARHIGILIISTSQGLMSHHTASERKIGGSLLAYLY